MATIHKRRLVSGEIVWELTHGTGRDRRRIVAGHSKEEAQATLNQFERQLALHGEAPSDDGVDAAVGRFAVYIQANRRPSTVRRYLRVLRTFHRCYLAVYHPGITFLRQIKPVHLEQYKIKRIEGGLTETDDAEVRERDEQLRAAAAATPSADQRRDNAKFGWLGRKRLRERVTHATVNYELRVIGTFCRWAVRHNHLFVNPATNIERFRIPKRALPKFLPADQLKRLFEACDERERRVFLAILLTGMRKGEVTHLLWSDVNFELGVIFIQEKPNWKPKTDERVIPMSPGLRQVLLEQHALRKNDGLVFPNKDGHRDTHLLPKLQKICRRAGLKPTTVHALRHSFGAHLRMAGVSLADIADLMGHKDLATTQIYAKVHQEHLRAAVTRITPLTDGLTSITPAPWPALPAKATPDPD